jgi:hypothetical protein
MKSFKQYTEETEYFDGINNLKALKDLMKKLGKKDNKPRTVSVDFGRAYVKVWNSPSKISYTAYGDSLSSARGYWVKGKLIKFSEKLVTKYQNTGMGTE